MFTVSRELSKGILSEMTVGLANELLSMVFRRVLSNYRVIIEQLSAVSPYFY